MNSSGICLRISVRKHDLNAYGDNIINSFNTLAVQYECVRKSFFQHFSEKLPLVTDNS